MTSPNDPDPVRDTEIDVLIGDCIDMLLSTLPPEQAGIVRAVDLLGALPQSVADIHGLSLDEMTRRLGLGRQGLADRFAEMHMICPQHGMAGCDCRQTGDLAS